jgi:hypothetical protein
MQFRVLASLALVSLAATGCIVPEKATPTVGFGTTLATKFVHRGMTLVDNPVLQPRLSVAMPTVFGDTDRLQIDVEGSMELRNDTGGAWFPDGHAGRFTQFEMVGSYQRTFGDLTLRGGLHSYNLPNGLEFQNGERGGTNEVFVLANMTVLEANPYLAVHYDFDEVRGAYYRGGIAETIQINEKWAIDLDGSLGYVSEAQSAWLYGFDEPGLADLRGEVVLKYQYDARTSVRIGAHGSMIVDDQIDEWFTALRIDDDPIWFSLGVGWVF